MLETVNDGTDEAAGETPQATDREEVSCVLGQGENRVTLGARGAALTRQDGTHDDEGSDGEQRRR